MRRQTVSLVRPIRSLRHFLGLRPRQQDAALRAFDVLTDARSTGTSVSRSARVHGTTVRTVRRYVGPALRGAPNGRLVPRGTDRLVRPMRVIADRGVVEVGVRGDGKAGLNARHVNAVKHFLATGESGPMTEFRGKRVGGHRLQTDLDALEDLGRRGELDWLDLYLVGD